MPGTQKAKQNKEVWVPVFACGETGMTPNFLCARGGEGRISLRSAKLVQRIIAASYAMLS